MQAQAWRASRVHDRHAYSCRYGKSSQRLAFCYGRDQAPWQARAATFAPVISALGGCMALRYSCPAEHLWRAAAEAFNAVRAAASCFRGLPFFECCKLEAEQPEIVIPKRAFRSSGRALPLPRIGTLNTLLRLRRRMYPTCLAWKIACEDDIAKVMVHETCAMAVK